VTVDLGDHTLSPFPSPRLFAGRGRVRGLGEWPHLFNYAPIVSAEHSCGFELSGYSPWPLTLSLPARRRGEASIPSFSTRRGTTAIPWRARAGGANFGPSLEKDVR
jgi:hypothetical protein